MSEEWASGQAETQASGIDKVTGNGPLVLGAEKLSDSGFILKECPTGFADGLYGGWEGMERVKDDSKCPGTNYYIDVLTTK